MKTMEKLPPDALAVLWVFEKNSTAPTAHALAAVLRTVVDLTDPDAASRQRIQTIITQLNSCEQ